jgi:transcriptional regulator with XRE-family HTH domain
MQNEGIKDSTPQWAELIKQKRKQLGESQTEFGKRFNVSHAAVSQWESGTNDVPGEVTWWVIKNLDYVYPHPRAAK